MTTAPERLRKQYTNSKYPNVVLKFEDGHEIVVHHGATKSFDAWRGEHVHILVVWDTTSMDREKIETRRGEQFEDATG